jgi:hypothetical protein
LRQAQEEIQRLRRELEVVQKDEAARDNSRRRAR